MNRLGERRRQEDCKKKKKKKKKIKFTRPTLGISGRNIEGLKKGYCIYDIRFDGPRNVEHKSSVVAFRTHQTLQILFCMYDPGL